MRRMYDENQVKDIAGGGSGGGGFKLYRHTIEDRNGSITTVLSWKKEKFVDTYGTTTLVKEVLRNEPSILFGKAYSWNPYWLPVTRDNTDGYCYAIQCSLGGEVQTVGLGGSSPIKSETVEEI